MKVLEFALPCPCSYNTCPLLRLLWSCLPSLLPPTLHHRAFTENLPEEPLGAPLKSTTWPVLPKDLPIVPMLGLAYQAKSRKEKSMGRIFTLFPLPTPTIIFSCQTIKKGQKS